MNWGPPEEIYDSVERSNLTLLKARLPHYLDFHAANRGHLPSNFIDATSGAPLDAADARFKAMNKIGYYNYCVLVDLVLVYREYKSIPQYTKDLLDVYWMLSRFFMRLGGAIDKAAFLAKSQEQDFDRGQFKPSPLGAAGRSLGQELRDTLIAADKYNNAVKHHGLPALRVKAGGAGDPATMEVLVPDNFAPDQVGWAAQTPRQAPIDVCKAYQKMALSSFDTFFEKLASDAPDLHKRWSLKVSTNPQGIVKAKAYSSGSVGSVPDGYVVECTQQLRL